MSYDDLAKILKALTRQIEMLNKTLRKIHKLDEPKPPEEDFTDRRHAARITPGFRSSR
ncbi:MAG: hypothetical protein JW765_05195 [Deltaproteobacteria bacterium]|nr:hypothetical protein [Candidatus Zymogenaceae bacterium]